MKESLVVERVVEVEKRKKDCEQFAKLTIWFQGQFRPEFKVRIRKLFAETIFRLDKVLGRSLANLESVICMDGASCRRVCWPEPLPGEDWEYKYQILLSGLVLNRSDEEVRRTFAHELGHIVLNHCIEAEREGENLVKRQEAEVQGFCAGMGF